MGNFTTADCSLRLGRKTIGFELNTNSYDYNMQKLEKIQFGIDVKDKIKIENPFFNQGKKLTEEDREIIHNRFNDLFKIHKTKKEVISILSKEFGRGPFSIKNILDEKIK